MHSIRLALVMISFQAFQAVAEPVSVYFDSSLSQSRFAAAEIRSALIGKGHVAELRSLSTLASNPPQRRIVLARPGTPGVSPQLTAEGGIEPQGLEEQAFALITTGSEKMTYWVLGGDANGVMYGGLHLAERIRAQGIAGRFDHREAPYVRNRGIKLNLPFDRRIPTYYGSGFSENDFKGDAARKAIPAVWDMGFWREWFDEMARHRFNVLSIWNCHPFPAMLDIPEALPDIQGFDGYSKAMSPAKRADFWKEVMAYGKGRGFQIYFVTWNIYTYGATGKGGIDNNPANAATRAYFRRTITRLFETFPDLDGLGITAGENMSRISAEEEGKWMWETYGQGMTDYAKSHPDRNITFIHRWHQASIAQVMNHFGPLLALPNVRLDMSYKYSAAHVYSAPAPRLIYTKDGDVPADLARNNKKTWLEVRNDDFYFLHWADPEFVREYLKAFPDKERYIQGFFYGSDGWTGTRDFVNKENRFNGGLEIKRVWLTQMLWGRLAYNPQTPNTVFQEAIALRYPGAAAASLFEAWMNASRALPLATEMIQGTYSLDFQWWPELCQATSGFRTVADFATASPAVGSTMCSIARSAENACPGGRSAGRVADTISAFSRKALNGASGLPASLQTELGRQVLNIRAQAYLGLYYAGKIKGAVDVTRNSRSAAMAALGEADCAWKNYVYLMESLFTGAQMMRTRDFTDWHAQDSRVVDEYTGLGGSADHPCTIPSEISRAGTAPNAARVLGVSGKKVELHIPARGGFTLSLFSPSGRREARIDGMAQEPGRQTVFLPDRIQGLHILELTCEGAAPLKRLSLMF